MRSLSQLALIVPFFVALGGWHESSLGWSALVALALHGLVGLLVGVNRWLELRALRTAWPIGHVTVPRRLADAELAPHLRALRTQAVCRFAGAPDDEDPAEVRAAAVGLREAADLGDLRAADLERRRDPMGAPPAQVGFDFHGAGRAVRL